MMDLLICEDKRVVLMGLKKLVQSLGLPVGEIYLAQDAAGAFELFSSRHIPLVMTDIQMPGASGLELLQQMQKLRKDFQAIIISGYDNFEYAKTAIHLGIEDYLLKPVDPEELRGALLRCIEKLSLNKKQKQFISGILLEQLRGVWGGELPAESENILLSTDNSFFQAEAFTAASFYFEGGGSVEKLCGRVKTELQGLFGQVLALPTFGRSCLAMICGQKEPKELLPGRLPPGTYCGVSPAVDSIFSLEKAALQAEGALCMRLRARGESVFLWEPLDTAALMAQTAAMQQCDHLCSELRLPEISQIEPGTDKLFDCIEGHPLLYEMIPVCLRRIDSFILEELEEEAGTGLMRLPSQSGSLAGLRTLVKQSLLKLCRSRLKSRMASQDAVAMAVEYMERNYHKPLTLALLANVVSLNYAYFSNIFKSRTGVSVTAYLQNIRLRKAKELLISTNDRIREVAHKVGFTDERYFEKLFKNSEGITPSEYRERLRSFTK